MTEAQLALFAGDRPRVVWTPELEAAYKAGEAAAAKPGSEIDLDRLAAARDLIRAGRLEERVRLYATTLRSCTCADSEYRHRYCKHSLGLALLRKAETLQAVTNG